MYYVGIDLHKLTAWICVLDGQGRRVLSTRVHAGPESLKGLFARMPRPFTVAVEATYNWYYVVNIAEEYAEEVHLANSYELKAFAKRHKKNDRIDAHLIAWLLQRGDIPTVVIPDRETRKTRELLRYRMRLVSDKTRNIARLKALLDKLGHVAEGNFNTKRRREEQGRLPLERPYKQIVEGYLERIGELCSKVKRLDKMIEERAEANEETVKLMSLPGLDYFSALLITTEAEGKQHGEGRRGEGLSEAHISHAEGKEALVSGGRVSGTTNSKKPVGGSPCAH